MFIDSKTCQSKIDESLGGGSEILRKSKRKNHRNNACKVTAITVNRLDSELM
jgi:hypothetical protein